MSIVRRVLLVIGVVVLAWVTLGVAGEATRPGGTTRLRRFVSASWDALQDPFTRGPAFSAEDSAAVVRATEARGAAHPAPSVVNERDQVPISFPAPLPRVRRVCVDTEGGSVAQSGEIAVSALRPNGWLSNRRDVRMWWRPTAIRFDPIRRRLMEPRQMRITARRIDHHGRDTVFVLQGPTRNFGAPIQLPSRGLWLLEASAGENWGCFFYRA
jgi:hypothetical protein